MPTNELRAALDDCAEALDIVWAGIGDALCSGKGIEKAYANNRLIYERCSVRQPRREQERGNRERE